MTRFRFSGSVDTLGGDDGHQLFNRSAITDFTIQETARSIIERVRTSGDVALLEMARDLDRVDLDSLEVPEDVISRSLSALSTDFQNALRRSARNIERVHAASRPESTTIEVEPGVTVTRRPDALARIGVYAPGGKAAYASSVLMAAIPARVAGVSEVILCSPPSHGGLPAREVLAASAIAGVDRVFAVGGAGAIAAMAIGTATVPRVDKIVGPGNAYVAEAKIQLTSEVAIDSPAGPSELLVIADDSADPAVIAREVSAQAEHDTRAVVVVIAVGEGMAEKISAAIDADIVMQPRADTIREALATRGGVLSAQSVRDAIEAANSFAPEHLLIATRDAQAVADSIRSAGSVFLGETSSVAFGDYITGANHVLPTGGMARC
ncbi:MAG TPA: histidinol dehydrogenase, partial [Gemmatimonadaceae bacterium]|nr:histidinol dehydrogenase [Gemmatimonadaceae bacterium]